MSEQAHQDLARSNQNSTATVGGQSAPRRLCAEKAVGYFGAGSPPGLTAPSYVDRNNGKNGKDAKPEI